MRRCYESGVATERADTVTQLIVRYKQDLSDAQLTARMTVAKRAGAARGLALVARDAEAHSACTC